MSTTILRRGLAPAILAAAVALSACGDDTGVVADPPDDIEHRGGADDLVLRVATGGGGFSPPSGGLAAIPELSVYGDGRAIVVGPTTLEFPGPALPNLQQGRLSDAELDDLLRAAFAAGLLADEAPDYGQPGITDQATTVVTVNAGGVERTVAVYALRFDDDAGLTPDQRAGRAGLRELVTLVDADVATEQYEAEAVAVLVRPYDPSQALDPALVAEPRPWPLADLAGAGAPYPGSADTRCLVATGADAEVVLAAAGESRQGDPWRAGDADYALVFRPLLPDERSCADLDPVAGADA